VLSQKNICQNAPGYVADARRRGPRLPAPVAQSMLTVFEGGGLAPGAAGEELIDLVLGFRGSKLGVNQNVIITLFFLNEGLLDYIKPYMLEELWVRGEQISTIASGGALKYKYYGRALDPIHMQITLFGRSTRRDNFLSFCLFEYTSNHCPSARSCLYKHLSLSLFLSLFLSFSFSLSLSLSPFNLLKKGLL